MDQNPRNHDRFELYQGIANLAPNGPNDGGLCVLKGSHLLHEEHFAATGGFRPEQDSGERENGYNFTAADAEWYRSRGCVVEKVCAGEGDLILWDSRLVHWNASPVGSRVRFASYVCYCPRGLMGGDGLARKLEVFRERKSTTHFPVSFTTLSELVASICITDLWVDQQQNVVPVDRNDRNAVPRRPDGSPDPANRTRPFLEPEETPAVLRLVGVRV